MARRRAPARPGALKDLSPVRILTQIVLLQLCYYLGAAILIAFTTLVAGQPVALDLLLSWRSLRGDVTTGWTLGLCWMMDSLITVIPILLLIARSKLVPDFALTIHLLNLLVTSIYTRSLPTNVYWWLVQICSAGLMTGLGVWACQWRELKPMAFGGKGKARAENAPADAERGDGHVMGSGRGAGTDGQGSYEMVGMAPKEPA